MTDQESCRSVTDYELGRHATISQVSQFVMGEITAGVSSILKQRFPNTRCRHTCSCYAHQANKKKSIQL